jgi:hypothetical protein
MTTKSNGQEQQHEAVGNCLLQATFLLGFFFDCEGGGDILL